MQAVPVEWGAESPEQYAGMLWEIGGAVFEFVRAESPERQRFLWGEVVAGLRQAAGPDGSVRLAGESLVVTARR